MVSTHPSLSRVDVSIIPFSSDATPIGLVTFPIVNVNSAPFTGRSYWLVTLMTSLLLSTAAFAVAGPKEPNTLNPLTIIAKARSQALKLRIARFINIFLLFTLLISVKTISNRRTRPIESDDFLNRNKILLIIIIRTRKNIFQ